MTGPTTSLVLRLAGPLQSWGSRSQFNRRDTAGVPTKSGIIGLLAAAAGRRRGDDLTDLLQVSLAVRTDQAGSLLRDYHTVSDYRGGFLPNSELNRRGRQERSKGKATAVTERWYLQDAVFVVAIGGPAGLLSGLADALQQPSFPLALGRRACPPAQPLLISPPLADADADKRLWVGAPTDVMSRAPWQASSRYQDRRRRSGDLPAQIELPVVADDLDGSGQLTDVPVDFAPRERGFRTRPVSHTWARIAVAQPSDGPGGHDPFALLGW